METLRIAFLSYMGRFATPPKNYGGEIIYWNVADELGKMGHEVTLYAAPQSQVPTNGKLVEFSSINEHNILDPYKEYNFVVSNFESMLKNDIIHDGSNYKWAHFLAFRNNKRNVLAHLISNDWNNLYHPYHITLISEKQRQLSYVSGSTYYEEPIPRFDMFALNYLININNPLFVYPDIDLDLYKPRYDKEDYVAWISRFVPDKGPLFTIQACAKAGVKLKMSGSTYSPDHKEYFTNVVKPYMDKYNVEYVETETREKLIDFLQRARALIFPPQYVEAFGYVALEALACGTPVLTNCKGGAHEIIEHKKSGIVSPNSVDAFAKNIKKVLTLRPQDARQRAEYFRKGKGAKEFIKLYKKILNNEWPLLDLPFIVR